MGNRNISSARIAGLAQSGIATSRVFTVPPGDPMQNSNRALREDGSVSPCTVIRLFGTRVQVVTGYNARDVQLAVIRLREAREQEAGRS
jgi:hypothetical protein